MKTIMNIGPTKDFEILRFYPLAEETDSDEQAKRKSPGYGISYNPVKKTIVITGMGGITVSEIEKLAESLLIACKKARAIAQQRGIEVG